MYFEYNGKNYEVIVEKKNNKNTYLRVKEDLKIHISTSKYTPKFMIESLVKNNRKSIEKMIDNQLKKNEEKSDYYYLGKKINVVKINVIKKPYLENDTLYIKDESDIEKWYKKQTKLVFLERLDYVYNNFSKKVPYPKLVIRSMTTRWGVCNKKLKKVTLNSELIHKDIKYLDYVIVHELSHFIHFDHSKEFWKLVEENEPNYKQIRKEMR